MNQPDDTHNKLLPRVVILALANKPDLWYFLTLWDLPVDETQFPAPVNMNMEINPEWGITYHYEHDVPTSTTGKTQTHVCMPIARYEGPDISNFNNISIVTGKSKKPAPKVKQGKIDHTRVNSLPKEPGDETDILCVPFVMESDTNPSNYFVGAVIEIPASGELMDMHISGDDHSELRIHYIGGLNSNSVKNLISDIFNSEEGEFSSIAIYGNDALKTKGTIIGGEIDLYLQPIKPPADESAVL